MSLPREDYKKLQGVVREIAQALGERDRKPLRQIENIIRLCGEDFARDLLKQTQDIQAEGGMMTHNGTRRRTLGGVFFHLAREQLSEEVKLEVFYAWVKRAQARVEQEAQFEPFEWDARAGLIQQLMPHQGEVNDVKITLQGRPGSIERRQNLVITTLQHTVPETITMPRGVPHPAQFAMPYTLYIGSKQWEDVEKQFDGGKSDDELVIEGFAAFDEDTKGMAVFVLSATTIQLQKKEKRAKNDARPKTERPPRKDASSRRDASSKPSRTHSPSVPFAPARLEDTAPAPPPVPEIDIPVPDGLAASDVKKYVDLQRAAATYRQRITDITAKPADQQFGLEMTQKLLTNTEKQIKELEKQVSS